MTIPLVSIVMPCYNAAPHLPRSVGSVLAQTLNNWELITVDDGSNDNTLDWLKTQNDRRIRIVAQTNKGVSAARNAGLSLAKGKYVAFLDADDTWDSWFLEKMVTSLENKTDAVLAYCGWQNLGLAGARGEPFVPPDYETPDKTEVLLGGCRWPIHACLTRHDTIKKIGGFNAELTIAEDYLLWMEVSSLGSIVRVPEVLAIYHHHGGVQATKNRSLAAIHTLKAKLIFLRHHPNIAEKLGHGKIEQLTWNKLVEDGNTLYWRGDLVNARIIFRKVLFAGRGSASTILRMIPSVLPLWLHRVILAKKSKV